MNEDTKDLDSGGDGRLHGVEWGGFGRQERIPELQREGATGANTTTLSGCVARGTSTGTYTLTSLAKKGSASTDADQPRTVALGGTGGGLRPARGSYRFGDRDLRRRNGVHWSDRHRRHGEAGADS